MIRYFINSCFWDVPECSSILKKSYCSLLEPLLPRLMQYNIQVSACVGIITKIASYLENIFIFWLHYKSSCKYQPQLPLKAECLQWLEARLQPETRRCANTPRLKSQRRWSSSLFYRGAWYLWDFGPWEREKNQWIYCCVWQCEWQAQWKQAI